ncbi:MAG TPA: FkbM family methyltransferase [Patescibacteria group bacterium]|nr:FkbM family methyltransferase [Patescibacteria group bacterium]
MFNFLSSIRAPKSYLSQMGEDKYLDKNIFREKRRGVFLDIGAHDGYTFSNTYLLEKRYGWTGVCVEPLPSVFKKLQHNRSVTCVRAAISNTPGRLKFLEVVGPGNAEMMSGIVDRYDPRHLSRVKRDVKERKGRQKIISVPSISIMELIEKYHLAHIDYCSIDTEGNEFEILKSIDFSKVQIDCFTVEDLFGTSPLKTYMRKNGYKLVKTLDKDCVFLRQDFIPYDFSSSIWRKLLSYVV